VRQPGRGGKFRKGSHGKGLPIYKSKTGPDRERVDRWEEKGQSTQAHGRGLASSEEKAVLRMEEGGGQ